MHHAAGSTDLFCCIPAEKFRHTHKFFVGNFIGYGLDRHIIVSWAAVLLGGHQHQATIKDRMSAVVDLVRVAVRKVGSPHCLIFHLYERFH